MKSLIARVVACVLLAASVAAVAAPALAQIGIPGFVTVGPDGVKTGKDAQVCAPPVCVDGSGSIQVQRPEEAVRTIIDNDPILSQLSESDKNNITKAVLTTGYVAAATGDIGTLIVLTVLSGDKEQQVPIPTVDAPPTGTTYNFQVDCIAVQEKDIVTAMLNNDPPSLDKVVHGDTLILTAKFCPEYKEKSVTSVTMKYTGRSDFPDAKPPLFRHYIAGKKIS